MNMGVTLLDFIDCMTNSIALKAERNSQSLFQLKSFLLRDICNIDI